MKPTGIVVHHSLTKDGKTVDWDAIKRYHTSYRHQGDIISKPEYDRMAKLKALGLEVPWADIGYHGGAERINGVVTVLEGRPITLKGGHTKGHNDMLGLCIVGNFDLAPPDDEVLQAGANMVKQWLTMFPYLTVADVHRHNEYDNKSCPGKLFPWDKFKALVGVGDVLD